METHRFKNPENIVSTESVDKITPELTTEDRERLGLLGLQAAERISSRNGSETFSAESISKNELLDLAGDIRVGTTNLHHVYEANLISEKGLRRLLEAYQNGGDVRRLLAEELLIRELRFERDPNLRDQSISHNDVVVSPVDTLAKTTVHTQEDSSMKQAKKPKHRRAKSVKKMSNSVQSRYVPSALVIANVTALIILVVLLVVLMIVLFLRH